MKNSIISIGSQTRTFQNIKKIFTGSSNWIPQDEAIEYVKTEEIKITKNGTYYPPKGTFYRKVKVNIRKKKKGGIGSDGGEEAPTSKEVQISKVRTSMTFSGVQKITTTSSDGETIAWVPEEDAPYYVKSEALNVSDNDIYIPEEGTLYKSVTVNVELDDDDPTDPDNPGNLKLITKEITQNGTYNAADEGVDGYITVNVNITSKGKARTGELKIRDDGNPSNNLYLWKDSVYDASEKGYDGFYVVYGQIARTGCKITMNGKYSMLDMLLLDDNGIKHEDRMELTYRTYPDTLTIKIKRNYTITNFTSKSDFMKCVSAYVSDKFNIKDFFIRAMNYDFGEVDFFEATIDSEPRSVMGGLGGMEKIVIGIEYRIIISTSKCLKELPFDVSLAGMWKMGKYVPYRTSLPPFDVEFPSDASKRLKEYTFVYFKANEESLPIFQEEKSRSYNENEGSVTHYMCPGKADAESSAFKFGGINTRVA